MAANDRIRARLHSTSREAAKYLKGTGVVAPTFLEVYGRVPAEDELRAIVHKYSAIEWLSFLSRLQTVFADERVDDVGCQEAVLRCALSAKFRRAFEQFRKFSVGKGVRVGLFFERQLATLQQYALMHANCNGLGSLGSEEGRDDLATALLMTLDLMSPPADGEAPADNLAIRIQSQIRMSLLCSSVYIGRSLDFYQLDNPSPSRELQNYLGLFRDLTGHSAEDFVFGGLTVAIVEESHFHNGHFGEWHAVPNPTKVPKEEQARCVSAFYQTRCGELDEIRAVAQQRDGSRRVSDWNLIAMSTAPVIKLDELGYFVLNLTAVGRSLFDGVRYSLIKGAVDGCLGPDWTPQRLGQLYGDIFEDFAGRVLRHRFGERAVKLDPEGRQRADFAILCANCVAIVEIKAEHYLGSEHASFQTVDERREELRRVGLPKAIEQIGHTIDDVRADRVSSFRAAFPGFAADWTSFPIVPIFITENRLPQVHGCWQELYEPLLQPLRDRRAAGPITPLRILSIDDLEIVPGIGGEYDFGKLCMNWGNDPDFVDAMLWSYLAARGIPTDRSFVRRRFVRAAQLLVDKVGLTLSEGERQILFTS